MLILKLCWHYFPKAGIHVNYHDCKSTLVEYSLSQKQDKIKCPYFMRGSSDEILVNIDDLWYLKYSGLYMLLSPNFKRLIRWRCYLWIMWVLLKMNLEKLETDDGDKHLLVQPQTMPQGRWVHLYIWSVNICPPNRFLWFSPSQTVWDEQTLVQNGIWHKYNYTKYVCK